MTGSVTHFEIYAEGPARPVGLHRGLFGWQLDQACRPRRNAGVQTPRNGCLNAPLRASRGLARRGAITLSHLGRLGSPRRQRARPWTMPMRLSPSAHERLRPAWPRAAVGGWPAPADPRRGRAHPGNTCGPVGEGLCLRLGDRPMTMAHPRARFTRERGQASGLAFRPHR